MSFFTDLIERVRSLVRRDRQDRELAEEFRFHVERETAERIKAGVAPADARRQAMLAFGGMNQYREEVGEARGVRPLQDLGDDVRYAIRALIRNPGFATTAVLVLGLGLGAATAVFSVVDSVLLADLPYPEPDRLVRIHQKNGPLNIFNLSTVDAQAVAEQQRSFEAFGAATRSEAALSGAGSPERISIARVQAGVFAALRVSAARGRVIQASDEAADAPDVVVVSHALAERVLGGAAAAVGKAITLDGVSHTVIGVLPAGRNELGGMITTAWPALKMSPPTRRGPFWLRGYARLRPGVTFESATRDLAGISDRIFPIWASGFRDSEAKITPIPLRDAIVGTAGRQVGLFAGAVGLVLLLAIVNVATLVLIRASAREPEVAVRVTLGAGRGRLARLLITENLVLGVAAGLVAAAIASGGVRLARGLVPDLPRIQGTSLDARALLFTLGGALLAGLLVSISPVLALGRPGAGVRGDSRRTGTSQRTNRIRAALVVMEFALALPLLVGAGLLLNSFLRLQRVDPGFDPAGVVAVQVGLPSIRYPGPVEAQAFWRQAVQRMAELPGVTSVGLTSAMPPDDPGNVNNFNLVDRPVPDGASEWVSPWSVADPGFFATLGVPLLEGRMFTPADTGTVPVVLVSRAWAARYYPGESAVGRQLVEGGCYSCPRTTVIGVVGDVKYQGLAGSGEAVYWPVTLAGASSFNLVVRSSAPAATVFAGIRERFRGLDAELPLTELTLTRQVERSLAAPRRWTAVLSAFAVAGVVLAALGIFGLMSFVVRQRRREIGVRLALGAAPETVSRLIVGRGMRYAAIGSAIGLGLTLVLGGKIRALLYQVSPTDIATISVVAGLLLGVGFLACWLPGRRAGRIRPLEAISSE